MGKKKSNPTGAWDDNKVGIGATPPNPAKEDQKTKRKVPGQSCFYIIMVTKMAENYIRWGGSLSGASNAWGAKFKYLCEWKNGASHFPDLPILQTITSLGTCTVPAIARNKLGEKSYNDIYHQKGQGAVRPVVVVGSYYKVQIPSSPCKYMPQKETQEEAGSGVWQLCWTPLTPDSHV